MSITHKRMIDQLKDKPENEPFALLDSNFDEIARVIKFDGKLRVFGPEFGDTFRNYTDFEYDEYPKLLKTNKVQNSRTLKHLYSPDVNKRFVMLLAYATGQGIHPIRQLLENYEDYYAFTQTTAREIIKHQIRGIGSGTANKICSIMTIARGEF